MINKTHLTILIGLLSLQGAFAELLFTESGVDPSFQKLEESRRLPQGHTSKNGVTGSRIHVNHHLVEITPESRRPIARAIKIHTLADSAVPRKDFGKWSRWYQEDGSTQVFRLFQGETNVRNARENAARIEAFSEVHWRHGGWHEWSGTYTLVKPHGAAIFQVKNNKNDWALQLDMNDQGDVRLNNRREKASNVVLATNMTGKPFNIRVRDNGENYEVFMDGKKVGEGSYARPEGETSFRWGMYLGKGTVNHEAMIFVSGATVN